MTAEHDDTDDHAFLGGRLSLRQFRDGHRAGTDACLLAAALDIEAGECVVDAGAGVGAAGLAALERSPGAHAILVERDRGFCMLAGHNIVANRMEARATVVEADLFDHAALRDAGLSDAGDVVISNPPFFEAGSLRRSPVRRRSDAHILQGGTHADWLRAVVRLVKPRGRVAIIHRPDVLPELLAAWPPGWGEWRLLPVHPRQDRDASRILIGARRGSRACLTIAPLLCLHEPDGRFTAAAEDAHRGLGPALLSKRPA